jgi:assimilatory nitrate reductase catalytic subunit
VGHKSIAACAKELGPAASAAEIGKRLKCGTNCGSCLPEIQAIISTAGREASAEELTRTARS